MNHNQILNVNQNASELDIQKAFRAAAMEIHPDHNNAPEAAEAFARIKEARDRLLEEARRIGPIRDDATIRAATAAAVKATTNTAYGATVYRVTTDTNATPEELAHIQELDDLAMKYASKSLLGKRNEPIEVRHHRRKIQTTNRRLNGKY